MCAAQPYLGVATAIVRRATEARTRLPRGAELTGLNPTKAANKPRIEERGEKEEEEEGVLFSERAE